MQTYDSISLCLCYLEDMFTTSENTVGLHSINKDHLHYQKSFWKPCNLSQNIGCNVSLKPFEYLFFST